MKRYLTLLLSMLLFALPVCAAPRIVASIAPLHALTSALTLGLSEPSLLLTNQSSPHDANLRPSQVRSLAEADLVIWIGPQLEGFLAKPVKKLKPQANLQLTRVPGLTLLPQREGGAWETGHEEPGHHAFSELEINPHLWLSPANAQLIARAICDRLVEIDPANQTGYTQNLAALSTRIATAASSLRRQLSSVRSQPYLVFHDAYAYFEAAFDLNPIGSIRVSVDRAPGARRLAQIEQRIKESGARCLFTEPQFDPLLARRLASRQGIRLGTLDPLGNIEDPAEEGWFVLMENLARNLEACLNEGSP